MTTIITRLYADKKQGESVVSEMKARECPERDIDLFTATGNIKAETLKGRIAEAGVHDEAAGVYAQKVADGAALVVVRAGFGNAMWAMSALDEFDPIEDGVEKREVFVGSMGGGYVGSDTAGKLLPPGTTFLTGADATKGGGLISDMFGIPLLTRGGPSNSIIKDKTTPLSSMFGMPMLVTSGPSAKLMSENTTPLSSMLGLPMLSTGGPYAKLITDDTTPLSSMFGLPLLTNESKAA